MQWVLCLCLVQDEGRFFKKSEVDFWQTRKVEKPKTVWVEPIVGDDGRVQTFVPPPEVLEFLDSPTKENGRKYLAWQKERTDRLRKAMQILAELELEAGIGPEIYYFSKPGCPWCEKQEAELGKLPVTRVPAESPLWARYGVKVVPTIVVIREGKPKVFQGFTSRAAIEKEVGRGR